MREEQPGRKEKVRYVVILSVIKAQFLAGKNNLRGQTRGSFYRGGVSHTQKYTREREIFLTILYDFYTCALLSAGAVKAPIKRADIFFLSSSTDHLRFPRSGCAVSKNIPGEIFRYSILDWTILRAEKETDR